MKIYCEHGALTPQVREWAGRRGIELIHFPYDHNSHSGLFSEVAAPSEAQIKHLNLPIGQLPGTVSDYSGSPHFREILLILGAANREDALHIDSAFKSGCSAFITNDVAHILNNAARLEALLAIKFFHYEELSEVERFAAEASGAC